MKFSKLKNKEARNLIGNIVWLTILKMINYIFPLITMPYLARIIGVNGFGKIAFASAIMVWIQTIADWGFNLTATRDVAQNRNNLRIVSKIFSNVLWARCLLMFLSFLFLLILIEIIPVFHEEYDVILVTFLMIPGHILFPDWFFQAMEEMKYITMLNVLMKFVFTIAVFLFIKQPEDYILQPLFISLGYLVSGVVAFYYILNQWELKIYKPNLRIIVNTIKDSTDVFLNKLAPNLYNSFSILLLGAFSGGVATGIYDGANRFFNIGNNLLDIFSRAFFPFLSRRPDKHTIFVVVSLSISVFVSVMLYAFAPWLVKIILSPEFMDSILVLRILAVSLIFITLSYAYGACYLIIHKQERLLRKITIYCSFIGFIVAFPLVYYYSYIGAAITVTLSRFLLGFSKTLAAKYVEKQNSYL